jgi:hypothetical protein
MHRSIQVRLNARRLLGLAVLTVLSVGAFLVTPSLGPGVLPLLLLVALPLSMLLMQPTDPDARENLEWS